MEQDSWKYIIINGKSQWLKVKNPTYEKGILSSIEDLKPFDKKKEDGTPIEPTLEDAQLEKRRIYSDFFKKAFKNILVLSGAGSSMDVGGLSMAQLWNKAEEKYNEKNPKGFKTICDAVNYKYEDKDLEKLLSQIEGFCKFSKDSKIKVAEYDEETPLSVIKEELFTLIKTLCTISEPESNFPHKILLEKLLQRKQTNPRVKIFTLNYDLLFEKAATAVNAIVIDGFSFTFPRTFSGRYFDYDIVQREGSKLKEEDNFIHRVFHLHKLHGSINWERNEENNSVEIHANPKRALMVYPREAKYEDSYEQPFF